MIVERLNKIMYEKCLTKQASCLEMLAMMLVLSSYRFCCHVNHRCFPGSSAKSLWVCFKKYLKN